MKNAIVFRIAWSESLARSWANTGALLKISAPTPVAAVCKILMGIKPQTKAVIAHPQRPLWPWLEATHKALAIFRTTIVIVTEVPNARTKGRDLEAKRKQEKLPRASIKLLPVMTAAVAFADFLRVGVTR